MSLEKEMHDDALKVNHMVQTMNVVESFFENPPPRHEEPAKKKTLWDILTWLESKEAEIESGLEDTGHEDYKIDDLNNKVDDCKTIDDMFKSEMDRLSMKIENLNERKQSLKRQQVRFRERITYCMKEKGFKKLPGDLFQLALVIKNEVDLTLKSEPNAATYLTWPDLVTRSYAWNTRALKEAIKADPEKFKDFGNRKEKHHVQFSIRKELKK